MTSADSSTPVTSRQGGKPERDEAMGGLAKGLAIIEGFSRTQPQLTVSEAAVASGTTPAAARRCLRTLQDLGYVNYDGKYFRPTPRMMRLGAAYAETAPLPVLAQPSLMAVRDEFDESVSLAVLEDGFAVFIARSEASRIVSTGVRIGTRLPAYAASAGRVLLAGLGDDELDAYLATCRPQRTTDNTVIDSSAIRDRILRVRQQGYSFTDEEIEVGVRALAVPVRDVAGQIHASMSISAFAARISMNDMIERFLPVLHREAAALGKML